MGNDTTENSIEEIWNLLKPANTLPMEEAKKIWDEEVELRSLEKELSRLELKLNYKKETYSDEKRLKTDIENLKNEIAEKRAALEMPINKNTWLRLHTPPKKARECRTARQRWVFAKSKERYDRSQEGMRINNAVQDAFNVGEIGRVEGFMMVESVI